MHRLPNDSRKDSEDALVEFLQQIWPLLDSFDEVVDGSDESYSRGNRFPDARRIESHKADLRHCVRCPRQKLHRTDVQVVSSSDL